MNSRRAVTQSEIMITLMQLEQEVEKERLDFARPLIEALRHALVRDAQLVGAPPGTLSVQGWLALLARWEEELQRIPPRRARYVKSFFQELLERADVAGSPVGMMVGELTSLLDVASFAETTRAAA